MCFPKSGTRERTKTIPINYNVGFSFRRLRLLQRPRVELPIHSDLRPPASLHRGCVLFVCTRVEWNQAAFSGHRALPCEASPRCGLRYGSTMAQVLRQSVPVPIRSRSILCGRALAFFVQGQTSGPEFPMASSPLPASQAGRKLLKLVLLL